MRLGRLSRPAVLAAGLVCLARLPATGQSAADGSRGQSHDFGTVAQGQKVVHAFTLRNDGTAPLTIERVDLSAGSMAARFVGLIPPGQEGHVSIEWETGQLAGEMEAKGIVRFARAAAAPLTLVLKGVVRPSIELLPYPAFFVSVFAGESAEGQVRIVNQEHRPLAITRVEGGGRLFVTELVTLEAGMLYELRLRVPAEALSGYQRYIAENGVLSDFARIEEAKLLARLGRPLEAADVAEQAMASGVLPAFKASFLFSFAKALEDGHADDAALTWYERARLQGGDAASSLARIGSIKKREGEFEIKALESDLGFLRISRSPGGKSGTFRIDVGLDREGLRRGRITGSIRIATSDHAFPELFIPVRGELR